jgi:16S rRNA (cytosine967-C5)-methyltransferase
MTPAGRISAAIEVLSDIAMRKRPASEALKDWGLSHRFAGSSDRAAIGNLVFDCLRKRASAAFAMGEDSARALVLRTLVTDWGLSRQEVAGLCDGSRFAPAPLSTAEREGLARTLTEDAPAHVRGDYPEWLSDALAHIFGARAADEGAALAMRAPVDLRVNRLKADRDKVLKALARFEAAHTPYAPCGIRIAARQGPARSPHVEAEAGHGKGWFEVQDEGSQVAALMTGAGPRQQVIDLCAGGGGKTLALAAQMQNTGQLYAFDTDRLRLRPIFERLKRAGARNVQVLPAGEDESLVPLHAKMDRVVIDAPCTGSGVWRRRPDAKWRLSPEMLEMRLAEQCAVLEEGATLVKPGGRLAYITCSVLPQENIEQVAAFLSRHEDFKIMPWRELWSETIPVAAPDSADGSDETLLMTPLTHGTDGFFVASLERKS